MNINELWQKLNVEEKNCLEQFLNEQINNASATNQKFIKLNDDLCKNCESAYKIVDKYQKLYEQAEPYYLGSIGSIKLPFGFVLMKPNFSKKGKE